MLDYFSSLISDPIAIVKLVTIVALFVACIVIISICVSKSKEKRFNFDQLDLNNESEKKRIAEKNVKMMPWEAIIFRTFGIKKPSRTLLLTERIGLASVAIILGIIFHWMAVYFVFEVIMYIWSNWKTAQVEDENGLTFIPKTNAFLDMYIPAVNNGQSVNQIMDRFVDQEKDPELTLWWNSENRNEIDPPLAWNDVVKIYRNGYYSEQNGNVDSAEVYQRDIMKQMAYYNMFKEKIGEIKPIKLCYYVFMPIILIMSWINDPSFWGGVFGIVDVILLCMLLFIFTFFMNDIHKETCQKLF